MLLLRSDGNAKLQDPVWIYQTSRRNVIEQDHRTVKKRVWLAKGYGSKCVATIQGIETVHIIRKGTVRWLAKGDAVG